MTQDLHRTILEKWDLSFASPDSPENTKDFAISLYLLRYLTAKVPMRIGYML